MTEFLQQRQQVVDVCQQLHDSGFFAATGGNLMLRLDDDLVAVTPSATDYQSMGVPDIALLRLSDLVQVGGDKSPSVESAMHAGILRRRPELNCTIHTHQPLASACALLRCAPPVPEALRPLLGDSISVVGYAPSGSGWLAQKLTQAAGHGRCWLMANHGVVCAATDAAQALQALQALEQLCADWLTQRIRSNMAASQHEQTLQQVLSALQGSGHGQ